MGMAHGPSSGARRFWTTRSWTFARSLPASMKINGGRLKAHCCASRRPLSAPVPCGPNPSAASGCRRRPGSGGSVAGGVRRVLCSRWRASAATSTTVRRPAAAATPGRPDRTSGTVQPARLRVVARHSWTRQRSRREEHAALRFRVPVPTFPGSVFPVSCSFGSPACGRERASRNTNPNHGNRKPDRTRNTNRHRNRNSERWRRNPGTSE